MKPRAASREKSAGGREVVRISSCPAFDAYLSANKWPVDQQKSKEMFARLGEQMRDRCEREVRQLAHLSIIKQDAFAAIGCGGQAVLLSLPPSRFIKEAV